ncbi:DUF1015 domain-containing protein [Nannocystis pusilla]|uniref:DUF1015 domain-containing protein n=1 Tax=Nannocystis pusilla TaxID=889268 RepID=A0ABS7TY23_9BACT|nr:DUF1015 domain-containing protein [Nannocystis pusilla]MBZ5713160.1 DUF1015 domain-containing protein [Nannocystis pusilla]
MAHVRPLRGFRYDLPRLGDAGLLLAPPYDVVDAAGRERIGARSPHNCIHVILPEGEGDAKYEVGARRFAALEREALVRDAAPSFYVYHQTFTSEGQQYTRKGFIGLIELTRFGAGPVLAHERTLSGPKADRLKLMRACQAHLELVFGMFSDPGRAWEAATSRALGSAVLECDFDGTHHALYRVDDPAATAALTDVLADKKIYIADGHHRYETMCSFRAELEAAGKGEVARWGLIFLSNLDDPGLVVLPTHRLIHSVPGLDLAAALAQVEPFFTITHEKLPDSGTAVRARLAEAGARGAAFGLAAPATGELVVLTLRPDFDPAAAGLQHLAPALQRLDVALLHELILDRGFGVTREAQAQNTNIRYYKSTDEALAVARAGGSDVQLVCFMNPTPVHDVRAVCDSGEVMPQKSTFFYPKIPTGLVFHDLKEGL